MQREEETAELTREAEQDALVDDDEKDPVVAELGEETPPPGGHVEEGGASSSSSSATADDISMVSGAGFGSTPRQLRAADYGALKLPTAEQAHFVARQAYGSNGIRQLVLLGTLERLERASPTAHFHHLAQRNLQRWQQTAAAAAAAAAAGAREGAVDGGAASGGAAAPPPPTCHVVVRPGDWGVVTQDLTREYGITFAALNMANAYGPGGGYADGMVAQEENMFRRTDCHFSVSRSDMEETTGLYRSEVTALLSGVGGRVYLDIERPRVCIRGPEDRSRRDLGYEWLPEDEIFPFYELRSAAVDLRPKHGQHFDPLEMARRIAAQLDTLIEKGVRHCVLSAFGCGAFLNPAETVAMIYRDELRKRATGFDVVAFAIFHAGYGPNNLMPFARAFEGWAE